MEGDPYFSSSYFVSLVKKRSHTKIQLFHLPGSAPKVCVGGGGVEGNFSVTLWSDLGLWIGPKARTKLYNSIQAGL